MPIVVECPGCRRRLEAKDEWAGRRIRCPTCGQTLAIPGSAYRVQPSAMTGGSMLDLLEDAAAAAPITPAPQRAIPQRVTPTKRRKNSGSSKKLYFAIGSMGGVGLAILCCGVGAVMLGPGMDAAKEAAIRYKSREAAAKGAPIPVVLAPPPGSVSAEPGPPTGPVWAPDPQLAPQLTTNVTFDRYSLRLPEGFSVAKTPWNQEMLGVKVRNWFWASIPLPNGARHLIAAEVIEFTIDPERFAGDLEAELAQRLSWNTKPDRLSEFRHTAGERGQLAGIQFIRSSFSGSRNGVQIHGMLMLAMDGNRMLELRGQWLVPPGTAEYQLFEAAMLSFRKR